MKEFLKSVLEFMALLKGKAKRKLKVFDAITKLWFFMHPFINFRQHSHYVFYIKWAWPAVFFGPRNQIAK